MGIQKEKKHLLLQSQQKKHVAHCSASIVDFQQVNVSWTILLSSNFFFLLHLQSYQRYDQSNMLTMVYKVNEMYKDIIDAIK